MANRPHFTQFRSRIQKRDQMLGTFIKMPTTQVVEICGQIGFDYVVIDQEHAPLDRNATDLMILGARAYNCAPIVRVGDSSDHNILNVLDSGAIGIMVPHCSTPEKAEQIAKAARYKGGTRGFGSMSRAGDWGIYTGPQHITKQDSEVAVLAMIEDLDAVDRVSEICKVPGIDALFIGRGDLTAALGGEGQTNPQTRELVVKIAKQANEAKMPFFVLASNRADAQDMKSLGASSFLSGSDHAFIKSAATAAFKDFQTPL